MLAKTMLDVTNIVLEDFVEFVEEFFEDKKFNDEDGAEKVMRDGMILYFKHLKEVYLMSKLDDLKEESEE